jgi:hypothetical protein
MMMYAGLWPNTRPDDEPDENRWEDEGGNVRDEDD